MATVTIEEKLLDKQNSRNIIRAKLVELGLAESGAKLDALAAIIDNIVNRGAVSAQVKEGEVYVIQEGYHNGAGTVVGVAGGGNYTLEPTRTVKPTKKQQPITPASGFYGLEGVIVEAIPNIYQDVSSVTAAAGDVLTGMIIVLADGTIVAGTMPDNGAVNKTLDATTVSYTIPAGKHSGTGVVKITLEEKTGIVPTKASQTITPTAGKVLSKVVIEAIPEKFVDNSGVTASDADVLDGKPYGAPGEVRTGTMPNNGAVSKTLDTTTTTYGVPEGYHDGTGSVKVAPEDKEATPSKSEQTVSASAGKVIRKVKVNPIPDKYQDVTPVTTVASHVLDGDVFVDADGNPVEGTMPNNGAFSGSLNGITTTSVDVPAGYTSGGTVNFDDTKIVEMLDAI